MVERRLWLVVALLALPGGLRAQVDAGDTDSAWRQLMAVRDSVRGATGDVVVRATRLIELGLWDEAQALLANAGSDVRAELAQARLALRRHRYADAERRIGDALRRDPGNREARLLSAELLVQAWDLPAAADIAQALLAERARDEDAALLLGRVRLLEKRYTDALDLAHSVQDWAPNSARAFLLEAEVFFWEEDLEGAEPALRRALELDPFLADARFAYGYAIWRRVDATQLPAMAAQWRIALAVDPLHYFTHWHWGNGHTHLTYADYAHPTDSIVRERLRPVDRLVSEGRIGEAVAATREIEEEFPGSALPAMLRGSAYYLAETLARAERLDSAQAAFEGILARKTNYGPAHNGLAAVIKQRQFEVLTHYDSLEAAIASTTLPEDERFYEVFADARYYPGERVLRMIRQQLGPTVGYLPMLHRQSRRFTIPPLHKDLAEVQNQPSFRFTTTFDNRQWMDIRGVGGGSTGIEYVERGAHWERNVLLHEYAHLFHGNVLTDAENRRIRELYHGAMLSDRTLDYYAANNESEYFAQAWEAWSMPKKVHPLNHKSMNTRADLSSKDPELNAFVDSMAARLEAALGGDSLALRSNWAETYVNLSRRVGTGTEDATRRALALLDTALVWDGRYLPALTRYATVLAGAGRFDEADAWLARAESMEGRYPPIQSAYADLAAARTRAGTLDPVRSLEIRIAHIRRALELEDDLAERASLNARLRQDLADHGLLPEAIGIAEQYVLDGPTLSTYLRDRRDEARAFALALRASAGHAEVTLGELESLVAAKPFNYTHRAQYADALAAADRGDTAIAVLEHGQRVLRAAGQPRADYAARIAELHLRAGRSELANRALDFLLARARLPADGRLARVLARLGQSDRAREMLDAVPEPETPAARAELAYTRAALLHARGDAVGAEAALRDAVREQPYHVEARLALLSLLVEGGRNAEAARIIESWPLGSLPPGPDYRRRANATLRGESRR